MPRAAHTVDNALLQEAVEWATTLHYDTPSDAERRAFERWRKRSEAHEAAWARVQSVFNAFEPIDSAAGKATLNTLQRSRRRTLRTLGALLVAGPAGWLAWQQAPLQSWTSDVATATGERRHFELPDGSTLVLNSASAVNIHFDADKRRIRLIEGEVLVTTRPDPRPFVVETPQGLARALGTRFSVRRLDPQTVRVAVFEKAVRLEPSGTATHTLNAGQQADFDLMGVRAPSSVAPNAALWEHGMLLARDMPLADVLAELGRYRRGVLRCHPDVAQLRVSGAISLDDTDSALTVLAESLPLRIERVTGLWVTVRPL